MAHIGKECAYASDTFMGFELSPGRVESTAENVVSYLCFPQNCRL